MFSIGIMLGAGIAAPVFLAIGYFARRDRSIKHELADIGPALRRSTR